MYMLNANAERRCMPYAMPERPNALAEEEEEEEEEEMRMGNLGYRNH